MTPQEKIKAKLESLNIPHKKIEVYGSQIVITVVGYDTAIKWKGILSRFTTTQRMVKTLIENKVNTGGVLRPSKHKGYLVGATI